MEELGEKRANGPAGHDDRPFRAEGAAGADGDRRGERLENRDLRLDQAAAEQDRFQRFGDAVAADFLRAVARHQTDDQRANAPVRPRPNRPVAVDQRSRRERSTGMRRAPAASASRRPAACVG